MFELSQLRCFVAAADELNFSRAATRLNMTQPPLGRQIRLLEHHLGAALFDRAGRSVRLTAAGRYFLPDARAILRTAGAASSAVRRVRDGKLGAVRIGFTAAAGYSYVPAIVARLRTTLPDVDLILHEMVTGDQLDALAAGRLDLALLRPFAPRDGIAHARATSEPLLAALREDDPRAGLAALAPDDFAARPFIGYADGPAGYFRRLVDGFLAPATAPPAPVQELAQIHSILGLVRGGLGAAIVPRAADAPAITGIAFRPLAGTPVEAELLLAWPTAPGEPAARLVQTAILADAAPPLADHAA